MAWQIEGLGQRTRDRQKLEGLLLALCSLRFYRADELARLVRRNPEYLQKEYLSGMVASGRLIHRYPGDPNHPQQAYGVSSGQEKAQ